MNEGFSPAAIKQLREKCQQEGRQFVLNPDMERTPESVGVYFVGEYQGNPVIFDACIYTLRLQYEMDIYEAAEQRVADAFPAFNLEKDADSNPEAMDYFNEMLETLQEEGTIRVSEFIELDDSLSYGVGLDACLNVRECTDEVIERFIKNFNLSNLKLDPKSYAFELTND
ncbi:hypothetical protein [Hugenholtzia roseola]|uniref:hypothetical protein n=1 Tax=Hugenholtzia roseola TaxID=1002 RepID=UPI000424BBE3|nr:hypothetical protein [Hugenholtzia roseola]